MDADLTVSQVSGATNATDWHDVRSAVSRARLLDPNAIAANAAHCGLPDAATTACQTLATRTQISTTACRLPGSTI